MTYPTQWERTFLKLKEEYRIRFNQNRKLK